MLCLEWGAWRSAGELRWALVHEPDNVAALTERGHALRELGRNDEGLAYYDHALTLDPVNLDTIESKIAVLNELKPSR